jgi:hypothetical protein
MRAATPRAHLRQRLRVRSGTRPRRARLVGGLTQNSDPGLSETLGPGAIGVGWLRRNPGLRCATPPSRAETQTTRSRPGPVAHPARSPKIICPISDRDMMTTLAALAGGVADGLNRYSELLY